MRPDFVDLGGTHGLLGRTKANMVSWLDEREGWKGTAEGMDGVAIGRH